MNRQSDNKLRQWLEAERQGEEDAAEEALRALFAAVPGPAPGAGFAERVMLAAALPQPAPARANPRGSSLLVFLGVATAIAALVALLGVQPLLAALGIGELGPSALLQGLASLVAGTSHLCVTLLLLVQKAFDLARGISLEVARNPGVAGGVILVFLVSCLTFRALSRLVARERNFRYATL